LTWTFNFLRFLIKYISCSKSYFHLAWWAGVNRFYRQNCWKSNCRKWKKKLSEMKCIFPEMKCSATFFGRKLTTGSEHS
jgi:hypothetical protein